MLKADFEKSIGVLLKNENHLSPVIIVERISKEVFAILSHNETPQEEEKTELKTACIEKIDEECSSGL